ncbi:MAG: hypothetical protein IPM36_07165 [Lewinellaceae bacterium]|nr:hypothetical protein [Lewinellaceae bacterium]
MNEARIQEAISWDREIRLYEWLHQNDWKLPNESKPIQPKEAFEAAIRLCNTPRSSSLYRQIASRASYRNCQDSAFQKMISHIKAWFASND